MYNTSVKKEYIENNGLNNKEYLYRIFNVIGISEQKKGKDIYEFSKDEIIDAICDSVKTNSISTLYKYYYEVIKYITWAARVGYADMVMSARLIVDDKIKSDLAEHAMRNIKNNIIRNPHELKALCERFLNISNEFTMPTISDIVYSYIALVYSNISPDRALLLKPNDCYSTIDNKIAVNSNGVVFITDSEFEPAIHKLLKYRLYLRDTGNKIYEMNEYLIGIGDKDNCIDRNLKQIKTYLAKYINTRVSRYNKENPDDKISFSINDVYKFGIVYRLKQDDNLSEDNIRDLLTKNNTNKSIINDIVNCYHAW